MLKATYSYVLVPSTVTTMGDDVFQNCKNVTSARVETNFTALPEGLFWGCSNLQTVRIPSVSEIEAFALYQCSNLTTIQYGGNQTQWDAVVINSYNDNLRTKNIVYNAP
ncbi:leucine-rich repeat protein [Butyrivibrio sp. AD3002]|uniref:leucine-rich repeat protein n=1 Tax=Butyrivibrio sp. AD3002 TaxID=1280670 RepID=UPI0003B7699B|nr:leucine-rich repeat protein [Butyrivibrio sp. AD3002]